jgi:hypothetical protein
VGSAASDDTDRFPVCGDYLALAFGSPSSVKLPFEIDSKQLTEALNAKRASAPCISCGANNWTLMPQAALVTQWINVLPAPGVPVSAAICNNCGFVRLHALGPLGLLPPDINQPETKDGEK